MNPGDKRALNKDHAKHTEGKKLRSIVSSDVLAALQKECLHGLATNFEALIRPVVADVIDRAFTRVASQGRVPLKRTTESPARKFHLKFRTNPASKSFTNTNLEDEHGDTICVMLIDANTGELVTTGPESVATLEVMPLMGDFNTSEEQDWDAEEFEKHVAKEREGKDPLLGGELKVHLGRGIGTLGRMYFTDNSSVTRSGKFRLGVRAAQDNDCGLMSIREGKSWAFTVIESRGKAYRKYDTPSPTDEVWRLHNIGKVYKTKLRQNGIHTVKDLLFCLETRPEHLREVLGKMSERAYRETIDHAKKCVLGDKIYIYPVEQPPYESLIFDPNCQVVGAVAQGQYVGLEMIDDNEKGRVDALVKSAYDHWDTDVEQLATEEGPSMLAPTCADDVSPADDMVDVAAASQEAVDGSPGVDGIPSLERITGQGYEDLNVRGEWGSSRQNLSMQELDIERMSIPSFVSDIMREYEEDEEYGEPFQLFSLSDEPSPRVGSRWWLRIRTMVRCALFIRRAAASARQLPP